MCLRIALVLALALLHAAVARADGAYLALEVGPAFFPDSDLSRGSASGDLSYDPGFHVGGAIGVRALDVVRGELGLSYRRADTDQLEEGGSSDGVSGDVGIFASMANGYLDCAFLDLPVTPYVGAGLGVGVVLADFEVGGTRVEDADTQFAYNVMGGVSYDANGVVFSAGYRYFATTDADIEGVDTEIDVHEVTFGVRYEY